MCEKKLLFQENNWKIANGSNCSIVVNRLLDNAGKITL